MACHMREVCHKSEDVHGGEIKLLLTEVNIELHLSKVLHAERRSDNDDNGKEGPG